MGQNKWYTWVALICAIWFALTSWFWAWLINIIFSYPFGVLALILWFVGRRKNPGNKLNRIVLILLIAGWLSSIITGLLFL
jgi:hypothetical protein